VHKHGLIATRVNELTDLATDEQILANEYIQPGEHPVLGPWNWVTTPLRFSKTQLSIRTPAPEIGEHTDQVLTDYLGTSPEELDRLRSDGVIGASATDAPG